MRQLAKINEVELSTHASPNIGTYAAGFQEGRFSDEGRENFLHEVERAVHFAADTAEGGPVVVHTGEFPRNVYEPEEESFEMYEKEREKSPLTLVDTKTGRIAQISRLQQYAVPEGYDKNNRPLTNQDGTIKWKLKSVRELEKEAIEKGEKPYKYILESMHKKDYELNEAEEMRYTSWARNSERKLTALRREIRDIEEIEDKSLREARAFEILRQSGMMPLEGTDEFKQLLNNPVKMTKEIVKREESESNSFREAASSYGRRKFELHQEIERLKPVEEYGVEKSAQTLARAAMYAYDLEQKKNLEKPLWIAPENWTPELYGAHPRELRALIVESRNQMAKMLEQKKGYNESEAKKIAKEHIKATVDVGHLNFWKKYYKGSDKEFKSWMDTEVKKLADEGLIGNVHLSDNFGYHDEHLAPGEGNVPIKDFVKRLEKSGYKGKYIGEPGGQKEGQYHKAWTDTFGILGSPMYRIDSRQISWSDMDQSYFGRAPQSPYFLVGDIVPSKDWTLWSETPME